MILAAFQASNILRYSVILFCRLCAPARLSGLMFSRPMKTRRTPARAHGADERDGGSFDAGQVRHEVVKRLEVFLESISQHLLETAFRLAGKEGDAHRLGAMKIGIVAAEHAHRPGDVEPADAHLNA